jgi:hypothetical protein
MSDVGGSGGLSAKGEREGKVAPLRARKGQEFPTCEPQKGHCESVGVNGQGARLWLTQNSTKIPEEEKMERHYPKNFLKLKNKYPKLIKAYESAGETARKTGPLQEKHTRRDLPHFGSTGQYCWLSGGRCRLFLGE